MAEVFEYELRGKDTSFGNTVKNAVKVVGELKSAGAQVLASFTGGLLGGGIAQSVLSTVDMIRTTIREAKELAAQAERLDINRRDYRGVVNLEQALQLPSGSIGSATEALRKSIADAIKGDAPSGNLFKTLGLDPSEMVKISDPLKQLQELLDAMARTPISDASRFAFSRLAGNASGALEPYAIGGSERLNFSSLIGVMSGLQTGQVSRFLDKNIGLTFSETGSPSLANLRKGVGGYNTFEQLNDADYRAKFRANLTPFSDVGMQNAERLRVMQESVQELRDRNNRANLSAEKQLLDITEKRLKKQREAESETDPKRKVQLEMDIEQLRAQGIAVKAGMTRSGIPGISRDMDQMARAGFFRGGAPDIATDTMRKQLAEMQRIAALLKTLPAGIAREM